MAPFVTVGNYLSIFSRVVWKLVDDLYQSNHTCHVQNLSWSLHLITMVLRVVYCSHCACVYVRVCVVGISDMYRLRITQTCSLNFQASNMKLSVFLYSDYAGHYTPLHKNNRLFLTSIMLPVGVSVKIFNCQPMSFGMEMFPSIKQSSKTYF